MLRLVQAAALGAALSCAAFGQCPEKFLDAGEVSASAPAGNYQEVTVTRELLLPKALRLDVSYLQRNVTAASDGAGSDMRADQIPPGLHLVARGSGGGTWSLANPRLEATSDPQQRKLSIDLWINSGDRERAREDAHGAEVRVRVCVKTLEPSSK